MKVTLGIRIDEVSSKERKMGFWEKKEAPGSQSCNGVRTAFDSFAQGGNLHNNEFVKLQRQTTFLPRAFHSTSEAVPFLQTSPS